MPTPSLRLPEPRILGSPWTPLLLQSFCWLHLHNIPESSQTHHLHGAAPPLQPHPPSGLPTVCWDVPLGHSSPPPSAHQPPDFKSHTPPNCWLPRAPGPHNSTMAPMHDILIYFFSLAFHHPLLDHKCQVGRAFCLLVSCCNWSSINICWGKW